MATQKLLTQTVGPYTFTAKPYAMGGGRQGKFLQLYANGVFLKRVFSTRGRLDASILLCKEFLANLTEQEARELVTEAVTDREETVAQIREELKEAEVRVANLKTVLAGGTVTVSELSEAGE